MNSPPVSYEKATILRNREGTQRITKCVSAQATGSELLAVRLDQYKVLSIIAQANSGLSIGQVLRGDAKEAALF